MNDATSTIIIGLLVVNLLSVLLIGIRVSLMGGDDRKLESRLTLLEARVNHLPTHKDLSELSRDITEMVEGVASLTGKTETVTQMLRTIQEHLLENDR